MWKQRLETIKLNQNNSLSPLLVLVDKTMQTSTQVWKHVLAWPKLIELVHHIRNEIKAKEHILHKPVVAVLPSGITHLWCFLLPISNISWPILMAPLNDTRGYSISWPFLTFFKFLIIIASFILIVDSIKLIILQLWGFVHFLGFKIIN